MRAEDGLNHSDQANIHRGKDNVSAIGQLESSFASAEQNYQAARELLTVAQKIKGGRLVQFDSEAYRLIVARRDKGETLEDIIQKTAANVRGTRQEMFKQELPLRQAQAGQLRDRIADSVSDEDMLRVLDGFDKRHAMLLDTPAYMKVDNLLIAGKKTDEIRREIEARQARLSIAGKLLQVVRGMQNPTFARPLDPQLEQAIKDRVNQGETLQQIEDALQAEVGAPMRDQRELEQTMQRIQDLGQLLQSTDPVANQRQPLPFVNTGGHLTIEAQSEAYQLQDELSRLNGELNSGYSSLQPQDLLRAITKRQQGHALKLNSPEQEFISNRLKQGQRLSQIKEQVEAAARGGHGIPLTLQERNDLRTRINEIRLQIGGINTSPNSYA